MKVELSQTKNNANNSSTIYWKLSTYGGSSDYYSTGPTTLIVDGQTVYSKSRVAYSNHSFPASVGNVSGSLTVNHNASGARSVDVSLSTAIYTATVSTDSGTWALDNTTPGAVITSAPNFDNTQNPVIKYSNPLGNNVTSLRACIAQDNASASVVVAYRDISKTGTSYTFSLTDNERAALVALLGTTTREIGVRFYIETVVSGITYKKYLSRTFTLKGIPPNITNFTASDTNSKTLALTMNSSTMVRYFSNASFNARATANDGATISEVAVSNGSQTIKANSGVINGVTSGTFKVTAVDSRGLVSTQEFTNTFIPYVKLTCSIKEVKTTNAATGTIEVTHGGDQWVGSFGDVTNNVKRAIIYRPTGGGYDWVTVNVSNPQTSNTTTITLNKIHPTGGSEQTITDGYKREWVVRAIASDSIYTTAIGSKDVIVSFQPIFYWNKDTFIFNTDVKIKDVNIVDKLFYKPDEEVAINPYFTAGFITNESSKICFSVPLGKSLGLVNKVELTALQICVRQNDEYYYKVNKDEPRNVIGADFDNTVYLKDGMVVISVQRYKTDEQHVDANKQPFINVDKKSATNNATVGLHIILGLRFKYDPNITTSSDEIPIIIEEESDDTEN